MTMNNWQELEQNLSLTFQADNNIRTEATKWLNQAVAANYNVFVNNMAALLLESNNLSVKSAASIFFKNNLVLEKWFQIQNRDQIKLTLLNALAKANCVAQPIAALAAIELPQNQWLDLIPSLLNLLNQGDEAKMAALKTIGYICESVSPQILSSHSNNILTAVAQGARKDESNDSVKLAAIEALSNSLSFCARNFDNADERNYIMQIVCESTLAVNVDVRVASFECLVRIVQMYYEKMQIYMQKALFNLSVGGMKDEQESVALQAVEFWSTICEIEMDIILDLEELKESSQPTDGLVCHYFAKSACLELTPILLHLLSKKDEEDEEDEWKISMAAATCLSLFANVVQDIIVAPVLSFVETNIRSTEWQLREASVMAFGSILEGPDQTVLNPLILSAFPTLLGMMSDPIIQVKDTAAWTLGRLIELNVDTCLTFLPQLVSVLVTGVDDSPRVASNCAWAFVNLCIGIQAGDSETYQLSPFFEGCVMSLMSAAEKNAAESNVRSVIYEGVSSLVSTCAKDCFPTVEKLTLAVVERLEHTSRMQDQIVGADEKRVMLEIQANLCSVLTSIIRRMGGMIKPMCDRIMQVLIVIMQSSNKSSTVMEDACLTVGAVCSATEQEFLRYVDAVMPLLYAALSNHQEHSMCSIAVGTIGDMCRALNELILPYCDNIMNALLSTLQSNVLHRDVKPTILCLFGDIALAIGSKYQPYVNLSMSILDQASKTEFDLENNFDYCVALREGIVESYIGIVQGMKTGDAIGALSQFIPGIFMFLDSIVAQDGQSEAGIRAIMGLLGDLAEAFPNYELNQFFNVEWIDKMLTNVRSTRTEVSTRDVAKWLKEMLKRQRH